PAPARACAEAGPRARTPPDPARRRAARRGRRAGGPREPDRRSRRAARRVALERDRLPCPPGPWATFAAVRYLGPRPGSSWAARPARPTSSARGLAFGAPAGEPPGPPYGDPSSPPLHEAPRLPVRPAAPVRLRVAGRVRRPALVLTLDRDQHEPRL